jgi:hypothetical protein
MRRVVTTSGWLVHRFRAKPVLAGVARLGKVRHGR